MSSASEACNILCKYPQYVVIIVYTDRLTECMTKLLMFGMAIVLHQCNVRNGTGKK